MLCLDLGLALRQKIAALALRVQALALALSVQALALRVTGRGFEGLALNLVLVLVKAKAKIAICTRIFGFPTSEPMKCLFSAKISIPWVLHIKECKTHVKLAQGNFKVQFYYLWLWPWP